MRDRITCDIPGHVDGCPGYAGGDHELKFVGGPFISKPLDAMRCRKCGHRMDDMYGCDSCAADREASELEHTEHHEEFSEDCQHCHNMAERGAASWQRTSAGY